MTIYAAPGADFVAHSDGPSSGLGGTMLVSIFLQPDDTEVSAPSIEAIVESPAGSSQYYATRTAPDDAPADPDQIYVVRWDRGDGDVREEELVVAPTTGRVEIDAVVTRKVGNALAPVTGAAVQVNHRDGGPATVYTDEVGSGTIANPLTTLAGRVEGWLPLGSYDLVVDGGPPDGYVEPFEAGGRAGPHGPTGLTGSQGPPGVGANWRGVWDPTVAYALGDGVYRSGQPYIANASANLNHDPAPDDGTWWSPIIGQMPWFDVTAQPYGAKGDGATDDRAAIQRAIDAAAAAGGGIVYVPPGTFRVSFTASTITITGYHAIRYGLVLKSGVSLVGAGKGVSVLQCPPGPYDNTPRGFIMNEAGGRSSNFFIRDLTVDGNSAGLGTAGTDREYEQVGIFLGPCTDFEISGVESKRWQGKNLHLVGEVGGAGRSPQRWAIHHCYFHDSNSNAIGYSQTGDEGMYDFAIHNNVIENNIRGILGGEANQGAEAIISEISTLCGRYAIANNWIKSWGTIGLSGDDGLCIGNYVNSHADSPGLCVGLGRVNRLRIIGNVIDATNNTTLPALRCADSGSSDVLIEDNIFIRPAVGTNATSAITFLGHLAERHTNLAIRNNVVKGGNGLIADFELAEVDGVNVSNNVCSNPSDTTATNRAINVSATCTAAVVTNNHTSFKRVSVAVPGAVVTGNRVEGPNSNSQALLVTGGKSTVTANRVKSYATAGGGVGALFIDNTYNTIVGNTIENVNANQRWVQEGGSADYNNFSSNTFIDTGTGFVSTVGTHTKFRNNIGYVTEAWGKANVKNGDTINHGLSTQPSSVTLTPHIQARFVAAYAYSPTTITVGLKDSTGTDIAVAEEVHWHARV